MLASGMTMLIIAGGLAANVSQAQTPGTKRTDLVEKGKPLITLVK
jgi:hypothetical protein